jgi:DNA modification methylase
MTIVPNKMRPLPDTRLRKQLFVDEAVTHPAKMHLGMLFEIIETTTKPGDVILDPMGGIGSTLMAALLSRNVIYNEMESHFVEVAAASWEKMQTIGPMLGHKLGIATLLNGDARSLDIGKTAVANTKTLYEEGLGHAKEDKHPERASHNTRQLSMSRHGGDAPQVGAVNASPPYEETHRGGPTSSEKYAQSSERGLPHRRYDEVDAIITSPPYEEALSGGGIAKHGKWGNPMLSERVYSKAVMRASEPNIGNLKKQAYWDAMKAVYLECWRVLKPGGTMVLVLKDFTRDRQIVPLCDLTTEFVGGLGFSIKDRWARELYALSFWRTLMVAKGIPVPRTEEVLVFTRSEAPDPS